MSAPTGISTWLTAQIGIRYPIIQAPMADGPRTPALVPAVGKAGALGSFGFVFSEYARTRPFPLLAFPIQNKATAALRARTTQQGDVDRMSLWAGQGYPLARRMSAAALVSTIAEEYSDAAERLVHAVRR